MIAQRDEIGHLDPHAELRGRAHRGHQKAGRARHRRIGQAQARQVENRDRADPELRLIEVELPLQRVMYNPLGPDLPKRRPPVIADPARGHGGLVKLAIAPLDAVYLLRRQLQLLVQNQPRARQDAVPQRRVELGRIGQKHRIRAIAQHDRPLDAQGTVFLVIADRLRPQPSRALKRLHIARGHQHPLGRDVKLIGHQHGGLRPRARLLRRRTQRQQHQQDQHQPPHLSHPPHAAAGQAPAVSPPAAGSRRPAEWGSVRSPQGSAQNCG